MKPQDCDIKDVGKYDRLYLIEAVKCLDSQVEVYNKRIDALERKADAIMKAQKLQVKI